MAYKIDLKEGIKALVLAPAIAGLAAIGTLIVTHAVGAVPPFFFATYATDYSLIVGALTFAVVLIDRVDKFLLQE